MELNTELNFETTYAADNNIPRRLTVEVPVMEAIGFRREIAIKVVELCFRYGYRNLVLTFVREGAQSERLRISALFVGDANQMGQAPQIAEKLRDAIVPARMDAIVERIEREALAHVYAYCKKWDER